MHNESSRFRKKLLMLVLPIAFQQFMLAVVSASDALMLGMLDQDAMSAVSLAGQITFVENLFLASTTLGLSILAAQYYGKGELQTVEKIFAYAMKVTALIALVFFLAGLCIPESLMKIFTQEAVLIEGGKSYLQTVSLSYLLTGISQVYLCGLKNTGKAGKSSLISTVSVVINILLNTCLIFGLASFPKLEIKGAALATVVARIIELVWCILETKKKNSIKLRMGYLLHTQKELKKSFWKYTTPVLGNEVTWGVGFTMYSVIMGHMGTDAVAANSIANIVKNLVASFGIGLGSGGGVILGNELGAGHMERAKLYGQKLFRMSIIGGIIAGGLMILLIPPVLKAANLSPQASEYLKWMLVMCSYYMVGKIINTTLVNGVFCAGGDSKFGWCCDFITMWCIFVPLGFIVAFVLKLPVLGVYFFINIDEFAKLPAEFHNYRKYKWLKNLTIAEREKSLSD